MNWRNKQLIRFSKQAAGRHLRRAAGALLCVFLAGCGRADRAMTIEFGEPVEGVQSEVYGQADMQSADADSVQASEKVLYVYVCGAVKEPGVVALPQGSRCNDALEAAGGFAEDAAKEAVNLAELVTDGMQLYFPSREEADASKSAAMEAQAGLVNINTSGVEGLCTLPGIGESKAKAIISYREKNGNFGAAEDIMKVPGIKESAYNQMKDYITVK